MPINNNHFTASKYSPKPYNAFPLLFHAALFFGSSSIALSKLKINLTNRNHLFTASLYFPKLIKAIPLPYHDSFSFESN